MNNAELLILIGERGMREYGNAEECDKKGVREFAASMAELDDIRFLDVCARAILESASVNSLRGNWNGVHAMASACHTEAARRHEAAGHAPECSGDTLYTKGFNRAYASQGYTPSTPVSCTCGVRK